METVVWKNKVGAIIKYPKHFDVDLVEKRHGITGNIMIGLKYKNIGHLFVFSCPAQVKGRGKRLIWYFLPIAVCVKSCHHIVVNML